VGGNALGTTSLVINNVGGGGAQTVKGIKVVNVGGLSAPTAFHLVGDYVYEGEQAVVGGAYAYRLYKGSISDPDDEDWYLRSAKADSSSAARRCISARHRRSSIFGDGSIDATGYGVGGSLTWYGNTGLYADAQAQVTGYESDLHSDTAGVGLVEGNDGLELGQRIPLTPEWAITPQAQLGWSSVEFDDFTDAFDAEVSLNSGDSLIGRLGLAVDRQTEWLGADGTTSRSHVYGVGNLYYDFEDGTSVDVAGTPVDSEVDALWGGLGLGGTYAWADDRYALYGEASAKSQLEDFGDSYAIGGTVGFKMTW
jgi:outer membrane autotransporter protein